MAKPIPMRLEAHPSFYQCLQPPLAKGKVRYIGEPVAVVVACNRYVAEDALVVIQEDYESLPAIVDVENALAPNAVCIHEGTQSNLAGSGATNLGDVEGAFRDAALTIRDRFIIQRHTGMPMETRGLVAEYNQGKGLLTVWGPTKVPHFNRSVLASYGRIDSARFQVLGVGGRRDEPGGAVLFPGQENDVSLWRAGCSMACRLLWLRWIFLQESSQ